MEQIPFPNKEDDMPSYLPKLYHWATNKELDCPSDADYDDTAVCNVCGNYGVGRFLHKSDGDGRVYPFIFLCRECSRKRHDVGE